MGKQMRRQSGEGGEEGGGQAAEQGTQGVNRGSGPTRMVRMEEQGQCLLGRGGLWCHLPGTPSPGHLVAAPGRSSSSSCGAGERRGVYSSEGKAYPWKEAGLGAAPQALPPPGDASLAAPAGLAERSWQPPGVPRSRPRGLESGAGLPDFLKFSVPPFKHGNGDGSED